MTVRGDALLKVERLIRDPVITTVSCAVGKADAGTGAAAGAADAAAGAAGAAAG